VPPNSTCQGDDFAKGNCTSSVSISDDKFVRKHTGSMTTSTTSPRFLSAPEVFPSTASASVPLQVFAEMPQPYGLHNLNNQSLFLADGIERSYYALPEDYALEQVTPPMSSPTVEKVVVTAAQSVATQAASLAPILCSKANSTVGSESQLVHDVQLPTAVQDDPTVFKEMPVYDIYEEDNSCLNCMDEQLATPFHKASETASSEQILTCFNKAPETEQTSACLNIVTDVLDVTLELQQQDDEKRANCSVIMASDSVVTWSSHFNIEHNLRELRLLWDPGAHTSLSSTRNRDIVGVLHNTVLQSMGDQVDCLNPLSLTTPWDPGVLVMHSGIIRNSTRTARDVEWSKNSSHTSCKLPQPSGVKWSAFQVMSNYLNAIFNVRMMQNAIQCLGYWSTINTSSLSTLALSYFTNHMLLVLSASYKEVTEDCLDEQEQQKYEHALTCFSKPHQVQFVQQTTEFSIITSDACTQRTTHSSPENYLCSLFGNNVLKTEYCQMSYVWEFSVSSKKRVQWDPGVKIYTDTWLDILTVWSEIDKPLSFTHIRDLEAWPNQFVGSTASYIWDPGTTLPWYKSIWWLMFIEENELVHFKLEFIHHQGVQENYNAKQLLLSSQDSVNIREIGIVFTTFRPP